jgi:hypothetical protein
MVCQGCDHRDGGHQRVRGTLSLHANYCIKRTAPCFP